MLIWYIGNIFKRSTKLLFSLIYVIMLEVSYVQDQREYLEWFYGLYF